MPQRLQRDRQHPDTLARPAERRLGITRRRGLHQGVQIRQQGLVVRGGALAPRASFARALGGEGLSGLELAPPALDRGARDARGAFDQRDAAVADRLCFGRRPHAPRPLGEHRRQRSILRPQRGELHGATYRSTQQKSISYFLTGP